MEKVVSLTIALLLAQIPGLAQLTTPVTNHASAIAVVNGKPLLFTFYGLDSTKSSAGVHRRVSRLDVLTGKSSEPGPVPDELGRLAASASTIQNKVYVAGGYAVYPNGKEKSSGHLYAFDPVSETFESLPPLPVPIDDQIQAVWRDSLLYVISGWSDSTTVGTVQVYNPMRRTWTLATPVPDESEARVFGGCGLIAGDTIFYLGGARFGKNYPAARTL